MGERALGWARPLRMSEGQPFDGLTCGAFKMQPYAANEQRQRIANFLHQAEQDGDEEQEGQAEQITVSVGALCARARRLRDAWRLDQLSPQQWEQTSFDSHYIKGEGAQAEQRSWSNWLVPGRLMLGQYPHCQPAVPGPSAEAARDHLLRLSQAGIDGFVCLQAEIPPQDEPDRWPVDGVRLPDRRDRAHWPAAFVRYATDALVAAAMTKTAQKPKFYYFGIDDLSVMARLALLVSWSPLHLAFTPHDCKQRLAVCWRAFSLLFCAVTRRSPRMRWPCLALLTAFSRISRTAAPRSMCIAGEAVVVLAWWEPVFILCSDQSSTPVQY